MAIPPDLDVSELAYRQTGATPSPLHANDPNLLVWLETATELEINALPFGVITLATDATVEHYNTTESKLAGLRPDRVIGRSYFESVAPCMNNALVAQRMIIEPSLDETIPYILTLRMAPTRVLLRMLKRSGSNRMYIIIERRI